VSALEDDSERNQEILKLAQQIGKIGHWEWNALTDENQWSSEIEALYGLPPGGFEGGYEGWAKLVHPDDLPKAEEDVRRALATGEYFTEFRVVWPDGSIHWLETRAKVFKDAQGRPARIFGVNMDVTDRKQVELALRESEARFQAFMNSSPVRAFMKDEQGRYIYANPAVQRAYHWTGQEWLGKTDLDLFPKEVAEQLRENDELVRTRDAAIPFLQAVPEADGVHQILAFKFPFAGAAGSKCVGGVVVDITEHKRTEESLREVTEELRIVTDSMAALVTRCSRDLRYLWVSQPYADWLKRPAAEIIGRPIRDVVGAQAFEHLRPYFERVLSGEHVRYEEVVNYSGIGPRWVNVIYTPTYDTTGSADGWVAVVVDVTARKEMEQALKEADRRKDEFLATLAHELRNPLAPIRNAMRILRLAEGNPEATEQARGVMERQVHQMVRLIDDLLDVSRITRGMVEIRKARIDLQDVINNAVETSRPLLEEFGHSLAVTGPPEPIVLEADQTRLAQVFSNLLNNAAKFTTRGGRIWLTAAREGAQAVVCVRDSGVGIAAEMLPRVFDLFTQADRSLEKSQGGLGIGLTLVRRLVELHGGTVEARSEGLGRGSEFIVRLPIVAEQPSGKLVRPTRPGPGKGAAAPCRILVVDDNRDAADSLALMLQLTGHEVHTAHDGLEAVAAATKLKPDVVLLDIGMPHLNGFDAARLIRENLRGQETLLVALTGWGQEEDRRRSQEAGFDYHLVKPVDPAALQTLLETRKPQNY
jgi:PAS domain S-box-containing protein